MFFYTVSQKHRGRGDKNNEYLTVVSIVICMKMNSYMPKLTGTVERVGNDGKLNPDEIIDILITATKTKTGFTFKDFKNN